MPERIARQALLDLKDQQDLMLLRAYLEKMDNQELKDYKAILDRQDQLGQQVAWSRKVIREIQELQDRRELKIIQDQLGQPWSAESQKQ